MKSSHDMYLNANCDLIFLASVLTTALDLKTYDKSLILVSNIVGAVMNMKLMNYYKCLLHPYLLLFNDMSLSGRLALLPLGVTQIKFFYSYLM